MPARPEARNLDHADDSGRVPSRLLSVLWLELTHHGVQPSTLLGDLPIEVDEKGLVLAPVHWDHFNIFLRRLERHVGGPEGLERCGEWIGRKRTRHAFRAVMALATSPLSLYRAAAIWGAPRAMPGIVVEVVASSPNHLDVEVRVPEPLGPCDCALHVATGIFRTLPRLLGMPDALVESRVESHRAHYAITVPSSRTGLARLRRLARALFAPGSLLRQLETRQLELNARHAALVRAHEAALSSEARMRARSDASVDMVCEFDPLGRVVFVSASVRELMGYSPAQVTGSHYRLWIPASHQALATARFEALQRAPIGTAIARQAIELHAAHGRRVAVEGSIRTYRSVDGEWRAVAIFRDMTSRPAQSGAVATSRSLASESPEMASSAGHTLDAAPLLERLESSLVGVGMRHGHPLERSLARLVALLEGIERGLSPARADQLLEPTRRMTRIVEHALLGEQGIAERGQWIEMRKLVARVSEGQAGRPDASSQPLRVDIARGPAEIFGPESLLEVCIGGLVDWARERMRLEPARTDAHGPILSIESPPVLAGEEPALRIAITLEPPGAASATPRAPLPAPLPVSPGEIAEADLALALVGDAARLLGGALESSLPAHEGLERVVRLPQPALGPELAAAFDSSAGPGSAL